MVAINQDPNNIHIALILSALVYITQRKALQCGMADANGDIINPTSVDGTQKYTYILGAK
jgi:hypothetical protein